MQLPEIGGRQRELSRTDSSRREPFLFLFDYFQSI